MSSNRLVCLYCVCLFLCLQLEAISADLPLPLGELDLTLPSIVGILVNLHQRSGQLF